MKIDHQQQCKQRPDQRHLEIRQPAQIGQGRNRAEVERTRRHFGQLKIRPGAEVGFAHGAERIPAATAAAQELFLPFAGHVGEQQRQPAAGRQHLIGVRGRFLQHFGEPFNYEPVHFLGGNFGGGAARLGGRARMARSSTRRTSWPSNALLRTRSAWK